MKNWYRLVNVLLVVALLFGWASEAVFAAPPAPAIDWSSVSFATVGRVLYGRVGNLKDLQEALRDPNVQTVWDHQASELVGVDFFIANEDIPVWGGGVIPSGTLAGRATFTDGGQQVFHAACTNPAVIRVGKFNDLNANGKQDESEPLISWGFNYQISDGTVRHLVTPNGGYGEIRATWNDTIVVVEETRPGWMPTTEITRTVNCSDRNQRSTPVLFGNRQIPHPTCDAITVEPASGSAIPDTGAIVTVRITGQNGELYRAIHKDTGEVVAGPSESNQLNHTAFPDITYQGQVYSSVYDEWTNVGCEYWFGAVGRPVCSSVTTNPAAGSQIPDTGTEATVEITGQNGDQYRIVRMDTGEAVAGPSTEAMLNFTAFPGVSYQGQVYSEIYDEWTNTGCEFSFTAIGHPICDSVTTEPPANTEIPDTGTKVTLTITGQNGDAYRIVRKDTGEVVTGPSAEPTLQFTAFPDITYQGQVYSEIYDEWTNTGCEFSFTAIGHPVCESVEVMPAANGSEIPDTGVNVTVTITGSNGNQYRIVKKQDTDEVVAGPSADPNLNFMAYPSVPYQGQIHSEIYQEWTNYGCELSYTLKSKPEGPLCNFVESIPPVGSEIDRNGQNVTVTVIGSNGEQYRIVDVTGDVVAGPSVEITLTFTAYPGVSYQGQVYGFTGTDYVSKSWTNTGCKFSYGEQPLPNQAVCNLVESIPPNGNQIPEEGQDVTVIITGENGEQYRIISKDSGAVVAGPSVDNTFTFKVLPNTNYQGQVYGFTGIDYTSKGWTDTGCEFGYGTTPPPPQPNESWYLIEVETVPTVQPEDPPFRVWFKNWTSGSHKWLDDVLVRVWFERYDPDTDSWGPTGDAWFVDASLANSDWPPIVEPTEVKIHFWTIGPYGENEIRGNFNLNPWALPGRLVLRAKVTWLCPYKNKIMGNEAGQEIEILPWGRVRELNPDSTYTVQSGDNLTAIAHRFETTVEAIVKANGITNPDLIFIGQHLMVP